MKNLNSFTKAKRIVVGLSGVAVLFCSIYLSKQGVGFTGDLWWMGLIIAVSLSCSEFMFNDSFDELTWTVIALGLGAYVYSINTNIIGFYFYRGTPGTLLTNFDWTNFMGGIFMDVYPEMAIAWALGAGKVGDFLGNVVKTWNHPEQMTAPSSHRKQTSLQPEIFSKIKNNRRVPAAEFNDNFIIPSDQEIVENPDLYPIPYEH